MQIRDTVLGAEISVVPDPVWRQICRCTVMKTSFNLHFTTRSNVESDYTVNYKTEPRVPELFYALRSRRFYNFRPDARDAGTSTAEMQCPIIKFSSSSAFLV